jgi:ABC-2 type transport system ATP-binding protein
MDEIRRRYGDNIVEVSFHSAPLDAAGVLPPEYRVIASSRENGIQKMNIQAPAGQPANSLLERLLPHVEITAFRELMPTMNDIFIKVVKNG